MNVSFPSSLFGESLPPIPFTFYTGSMSWQPVIWSPYKNDYVLCKLHHLSFKCNVVLASCQHKIWCLKFSYTRAYSSKLINYSINVHMSTTFCFIKRRSFSNKMTNRDGVGFSKGCSPLSYCFVFQVVVVFAFKVRFVRSFHQNIILFQNITHVKSVKK